MAQLINEAKRMQLLAGLITESQLNEEPREGVYNNFGKWKASFPEGTEFKQQNNYMVAFDKEDKELGKWNPVSLTGMHADDFQYKNLEEVESQTNELFGFGKKSQFKPEQKVIYTASNGVTTYNGEYIVGKIFSSGEIGLYPPDSPMKKISINAKPEELKLAESIEQAVNEALRKFRKGK
jgi:hypothetical protein